MMNKSLFRILVVEDDPIDFNFLRKAFSNLPVTVELFHETDAAGALRFLSENDCDIVLLDINLAGESGVSLLQKLRSSEKNASLPIIIVSSSSSAWDISQCYAAGANAYIEKPLSLSDYRETAESFCQFWLRTALLP